MRFSEYLTDPTLEEEGVWVRLRKGDAEVLVARAGNSKHEELVRRLRKKHGRGFRGDELPQEVDDSIALEALSKTILLDWRGIEGPIPGVCEDEGDVPYSTDTARALLKLSRDFRLEVTQIATEMEVFRREEQEAGKKPSRK
jgi:hypothetical protein